MSEYVKTRRKGRKKNAGKRWIVVAVIGVLLLVGALAYLGSGSGAIGDATDAASRNEAAETELESAVSELSASLNFEEEAKSEQTQNPAELPEVEPSTDEPELSESATTLSPELRAILRQHWEAMGGMGEWSKVESIRLAGTIERAGQSVDIVIVKKRPKQIRVTVTIPLPGNDKEKLQVIRAHDGETAWTATRLAGASEVIKEKLPPNAAQTLLADAGVLPVLIQVWREGIPLKYLGIDRIEKVALHHIQTAPNSPEAGHRSFYLHTENYLLLKTETVSSDGEVLSSIHYSDYQTYSNLKIAMEHIIQAPSTGRSHMQIQSTKIGVGIYDEYFGMAITNSAP